MDIALCGLPRAGKTTLWSILTGHEAAQAGRPETRRGIARVPDGRLDRLSALYGPKKTTHATVTYVDLAPVERGGAGRRAENPLLADLRACDALMLVIRAFEDEADPHPEGSIDPSRDLELIETEFLLADLEVATRRLERLDGVIGKTGRDEDKKERALLARVVDLLEAETPIRAAGLAPDDERQLRGYAFLTAKPMLVALNLDESRTADIGSPPSAFGLGALEGRAGCDFVALSARIEQEIATLPPEDAQAFRDDLGLDEPALDRLIRASYRLLGLVSFFTVGEDECRAWTIRAGTPARTAAGAIHSDIERGFIRAEVVRWDDLLDAGSMATARERATLSLEGKEFVVRDGDVVHFRHAT